MPKKYNFQGISKRARDLLAAGESKNVDYKEQVKGLHAEDLVAFANSEHGGTILVGVREISGHDTKRKGEPIGLAIDDESRLQIMGKALSCSPPIQIEIFVENYGSLPFYRVEIPSGAHKPYATNSGTYKIREDGRNNSLLPEQLLRMFLEREGQEFRLRFSEATGKLDHTLDGAVLFSANVHG
jgi:predicted HTH transcriptional regulator